MDEKKELTKKEKLQTRLQSLIQERQQLLNNALEANRKADIWSGRIEEVSIQIKELEKE